MYQIDLQMTYRLFRDDLNLLFANITCRYDLQMLKLLAFQNWFQWFQKTDSKDWFSKLIPKTDSNDSKNWFQWFQKLIPKTESNDSKNWFHNSKNWF